MIGSSGLYMSIVLIEPKIQEASSSLIAPARLWIVLPSLRSAWLKRHPIDSHPPPAKNARWLLSPNGLQWHAEAVTLRTRAVRITFAGKLPRFMIRPAIGLDESIITFRRDADLVQRRRSRRMTWIKHHDASEPE